MKVRDLLANVLIIIYMLRLSKFSLYKKMADTAKVIGMHEYVKHLLRMVCRDTCQRVVTQVSILWHMSVCCDYVSAMWQRSVCCDTCQSVVTHFCVLWHMSVCCDTCQYVVTHVSMLWHLSAYWTGFFHLKKKKRYFL